MAQLRQIWHSFAKYEEAKYDSLNTITSSND